MINKNEKYIVRDGNARMRKKLKDILDYCQRGHTCNEHAAMDDRNGKDLQAYHRGKAQAFSELLTFFDEYKHELGTKESEDDD